MWMAGMGQNAFGASSKLVKDPSHPLAPDVPHLPGKAKRVIYLHMAGAPSQHELFDYKPELEKLDGKECPKEFLEGKQFAFIQGIPKMLGPQFPFKQHGESGAWISDRLPHLAVDFAVEALRAYRTNCLQEGFEETNLALQAGGVSGHKQLAPLKRDNITVHFLEGGIEALQKMVCPPDQRFEIVVAAGVLCRVLGDHCRREMIEAFSRVADSAFVSMPTQDEFKSIQSEFNELRRERSQLLAQINDRHNNLDHESAQLRLVAIKDILKDAHGEGEIYYSAKRVRGFGEKIPDLKDHKIPYFLATPAQAQEVMDYGAYSSTSVTHGAFGGHSRWMICLGSQSFSVDSMENNSA